MSELLQDALGREAEMECKHTCSMGDGNEYEYVVVSASDSTTMFLCVPCFVGQAMAIVQAITDPDDPAVQAAVAQYDADLVQAPGKRGTKSSLRNGSGSSSQSGVFDEFEPIVEDA